MPADRKNDGGKCSSRPWRLLPRGRESEGRGAEQRGREGERGAVHRFHVRRVGMVGTGTAWSAALVPRLRRGHRALTRARGGQSAAPAMGGAEEGGAGVAPSGFVKIRGRPGLTGERPVTPSIGRSLSRAALIRR